MCKHCILHQQSIIPLLSIGFVNTLWRYITWCMIKESTYLYFCSLSVFFFSFLLIVVPCKVANVSHSSSWGELNSCIICYTSNFGDSLQILQSTPFRAPILPPLITMPTFCSASRTLHKIWAWFLSLINNADPLPCCLNTNSFTHLYSYCPCTAGR
jgi:hypothetical protein